MKRRNYYLYESAQIWELAKLRVVRNIEWQTIPKFSNFWIFDSFIN